MPDLLVEILAQEIPARMQRAAIGELRTRIGEALIAAQIPAEDLSGFVTPRRLAVIARGIPARRPPSREERRGPRVGAPPKAIEGFLRAAGLSSVNETEIRELPGGSYYFAVKENPGEDAANVLAEIILHILGSFLWSKKMRFPASPLRWVRPIDSVLCLFDGAVVPLALGEVPVGRMTRGHRFLAPTELKIERADRYVKRLKGAWVVLDSSERQAIIEKGLEEEAAKHGLRVKEDPDLLAEVTGLVEYPVVLSGAIETEFMSLPPEVLAVAMRTHQRYFSCAHLDGSPAPRFLFVANNVAADGGKAIVAGNERVLRARLADARYFFDQDRKLRLEDRVEALKKRVYHEKLGSVYDKVERVEKIAENLAIRLGGLNADVERARRAARLAKADLSTSMVGEFPELQGIMGRYYALNDGEDPRVAQAISDHYKPAGSHDTCPSAQESIVVALADKLDSVASFFRIGERPTGSGDPYALRRAMLGLIRIILENGLRLPLTSVLESAVDPVRKTPLDQNLQVVRSLMDFIAERLRVHLREENVRHDLITAVFVLTEDDLVRLLARVAALRDFLESEDGANLLIAYRRAANIVGIEEKRDGRSYAEDIDSSLFRQPEERALSQSLDEVAGLVSTALEKEDFAAAMAAMARLRRPVDDFFDEVTVNTKEAELRVNRLRLLSAIRATMNRVADFSMIEG